MTSAVSPCAKSWGYDLSDENRRLFAMKRRTFVSSIAASTLLGCASEPRELAASPEFIVENAAERTISALPPALLFWRIENFSTLAEARAVAASMSLAAEFSGRVWLVTLGERGALTPGATPVAEIGPVPRIQAQRYTLRLNHAHAPPGIDIGSQSSGIRGFLRACRSTQPTHRAWRCARQRWRDHERPHARHGDATAEYGREAS